MVCTATLLTACGGGGGGNDSGVDSISSPQPQAEARRVGSVAVTVTDAFGEPVAGITVDVYGDQEGGSGITDVSGRVVITDVPAGPVSIVAIQASPIRLEAYSGQLHLAPKDQLDVALTLVPALDFSLAIGKARVEPDGVQENGRVLEFTLRFYPIPVDVYQRDVGFLLHDCTPIAPDDNSGQPGKCIEDASGFDAAYQVADNGNPVAASGIPGGPSRPFAATVLIDQGGHVFSLDPADARLYGAKYLLATMSEGSRIAVAAFSATDSSSGEFSLLPLEPVTFFPEAEPRFYASGDELIPVIDSLGNYEGGASPLYSAISQALEFTADNTTEDERKALIVYTDGTDDTCGSAEACRAAEQAALDNSLATGVELIAVGQITDDGDIASLRRLPELGGLTAWVVEEGQIAMVLGNLAPILDGSEEMTEMRFRIESTTAGVFQSGRTVLANLEICPYGCLGLIVPVAIRIP